MNEPNKRIDWFFLLMAALLLVSICALAVRGDEPTPAIVFDDAEKALSELRNRVDALEASSGSVVVKSALDSFGGVPYSTSVSYDNAPHLSELLLKGRATAYVVPAVSFGVKTTVVIPHKTGGRLIGSGSSNWMSDGAFSPVTYSGGAVSRLLWTGEPGGTMVRYEGFGFRWDGVALFGRGPGSRPGIGLHVQKGQSIGTGKMLVDAISIGQCETGIQFGDLEASKSNCDLMHVVNYHASNLDTAYKVCHSQSITHIIDFIDARSTKVLFDFDSQDGKPTGGLLKVGYASVLRGAECVLRIGHTAAAVGSYRICDLEIDAAAKNVTWVDATGYGIAEIILDRARDNSGKHLTPYVLLKGRKVLTIRHSTLLRNAILATAQGSYRPNIHLDRCRLGVHPLELISPDSDAGYKLTWSGCCKHDGTPWPDSTLGD